MTAKPKLATPPDLPQPPAHLSPEVAVWFCSVVSQFVLEDHHLRLLRAACEAWDRCQQARVILAEQGLTYLDRFGAPRSRPEIAVERDSRLAFARLVRELNLDVDPPPESRLPRSGRRY